MSPSVRHSERGAMLVMVAISLLALTLFSAIVIDYGIMWTGRAQAQTAADAAALSGAISLTFDNTTSDQVKARAQAVGLRNGVWAEQPDIQLSDIQLLPCPITPGLPTGDTCVKADAFRTVARNNPLPTFFATIAGIDNQNARATATARAVSGTSVTCLKPWAVGDKWFDTALGGWQQSSTFDATAGDYYTPPNPPGSLGTGFSAKKANGDPDYYGYQMVLKLDNPGQGNGSNETPIDSAGWAMELCLDNSGSTGNNCSTPTYKDNISGCSTGIVNVSPYGSPVCTAEDPSIGCLHVKTGGTGGNNATAIGDFIDSHDPDATWTDGGGASGWQTGVINTTQSPSSRIVPVAIFDVPEYLGTGCTGSNCYVRVLKFVGFFIEGTCQDSFYKESYIDCPSGGSAKAAIVGRLVNYDATGPIGPSAGGFGQIITLVR